MGFNNFRPNVAGRVLCSRRCCVALVVGLVEHGVGATPLVCAVADREPRHGADPLRGATTRELDELPERSSRTTTSRRRRRCRSRAACSTSCRTAYRDSWSASSAASISQKAANHQYLEAVIQHVGIALVLLRREAATVTMVNETGAAAVRPAASSTASVPSCASMRACRTCSSSSATATARCSRVRRGDESLQLVLYATQFELLEQTLQARVVPEHPRRAGAARDRLVAEADPRADARDHELGDADPVAEPA